MKNRVAAIPRHIPFANDENAHSRIHKLMACRSCGYRNREDCFIALDKQERPYLSCPRCSRDPQQVCFASRKPLRANPHHSDSAFHPIKTNEDPRPKLDPPNGPFMGRLPIK